MTGIEDRIPLLVKQARAGNKSSLAQLLDHGYEDTFRMVRYRVSSRMDAEDLTQEILMQVIKSLPALKEATLLRSWLFRIALNRIRDFHRKKRLLSFFGSTEEVNADTQVSQENRANPVKRAMEKEFLCELQKFAQGLSRWEREVFLLRFLDQLEIKEIVQVVQKNENTVKTHLYRALKKFRSNSELHALLKGEEL